ncbi:hypothetical protein Nepgr_020302 [Nepenthes gracilis]|uniref:Uncharacterized protein n=1 Tax=Nepenthes gracilis TaxID=150966 RepID=A0AAD3SX28_NEPGR|nr:hypothetical protein Nepgr_020302 [Nepenthes gracilis]
MISPTLEGKTSCIRERSDFTLHFVDGVEEAALHVGVAVHLGLSHDPRTFDGPKEEEHIISWLHAQNSIQLLCGGPSQFHADCYHGAEADSMILSLQQHQFGHEASSSSIVVAAVSGGLVAIEQGSQHHGLQPPG